MDDAKQTFGRFAGCAMHNASIEEGLRIEISVSATRAYAGEATVSLPVFCGHRPLGVDVSDETRARIRELLKLCFPDDAAALTDMPLKSVGHSIEVKDRDPDDRIRRIVRDELRNISLRHQ